MTQSATVQAFSQLLKYQGRDYTYSGFPGRGLPSGIITISSNDYESVSAKAELLRVLRSGWGNAELKVGGILTDTDLRKDRRIVDIDDDGTSETVILFVSVD